MTAPSWRILPFAVDEPARLLADGAALLDAQAHEPVPTLRWYRATRTAVVLGRGQGKLHVNPTDEVQVLPRFSGGGAVLMDRDLLSLDIVLPIGAAALEGDVGAVFERVGERWAAALGDLGLPEAEVYRGPATARRRGDAREQLLAAVCYATLGRGEVLVGGRKLVGLAQRRRHQGALVQCGLLRRWRPGPLLTALGADPDDPEITAAAVGLDALLTDPPTDAAVVAAVTARLEILLR